MPLSSLVGLPMFTVRFDRYLVAYADRETTSQSPELRPYNWDISLGWQSCSCWR
jgi:hypothetical protein